MSGMEHNVRAERKKDVCEHACEQREDASADAAAGFCEGSLLLWQGGGGRCRRGPKRREGPMVRRRAGLRFKASGPAEEPAIAINATKWLDGQFGQEGLEKAAGFGSTGSRALTPGTTERHDVPLQNKKWMRGRQRAVPARALRSLEASRLSAVLAHPQWRMWVLESIP